MTGVDATAGHLGAAGHPDAADHPDATGHPDGTGRLDAAGRPDIAGHPDAVERPNIGAEAHQATIMIITGVGGHPLMGVIATGVPDPDLTRHVVVGSVAVAVIAMNILPGGRMVYSDWDVVEDMEGQDHTLRTRGSTIDMTAGFAVDEASQNHQGAGMLVLLIGDALIQSPQLIVSARLRDPKNIGVVTRHIGGHEGVAHSEDSQPHIVRIPSRAGTRRPGRSERRGPPSTIPEGDEGGRHSPRSTLIHRLRHATGTEPVFPEEEEVRSGHPDDHDSRHPDDHGSRHPDDHGSRHPGDDHHPVYEEEDEDRGAPTDGEPDGDRSGTGGRPSSGRPATARTPSERPTGHAPSERPTGRAPSERPATMRTSEPRTPRTGRAGTEPYDEEDRGEPEDDEPFTFEPPSPSPTSTRPSVSRAGTRPSGSRAGTRPSGSRAGTSLRSAFHIPEPSETTEDDYGGPAEDRSGSAPDESIRGGVGLTPSSSIHHIPTRRSSRRTTAGGPADTSRTPVSSRAGRGSEVHPSGHPSVSEHHPADQSRAEIDDPRGAAPSSHAAGAPDSRAGYHPEDTGGPTLTDENIEDRLIELTRNAEQAEDAREDHFRHNEEERDRLFIDNENRRDQEAAERQEAILQDLKSKIDETLAGIQPIYAGAPGGPDGSPSDGPSDHGPGSIRPDSLGPDSLGPGSIHAADSLQPDTASTRPSLRRPSSIHESIYTAAQDAAAHHAADIMEIVRLEREAMMQEREAAEADRQRMQAELEEERARNHELQDVRIRELEDELASVKAELENEKQLRLTEEAETRERERQESLERDEAVRNQLGDITNLVQDQRDECERKKALMEERFAEKEARREQKDMRMQDIYDMVARVVEDREAEKIRAEEERLANEGKPGIEKLLEELQRQNAEQRELLNNLSENWRADSARQHEETIEAVRSTAQEQVPFNVQGVRPYLDEFSKALASEVRMLLGEVGKLREERRNLQFELGYLMCMKAKYGPGGEFDPDWRPPAMPSGPPDAPPPPEEGPPPEGPAPAKPAWRTVTQRSARKKRKSDVIPQAPPPAMAGPVAGLAPPMQMGQTGRTSWATWQPDPAMVPTPTSVEPTLLVPDRGSPGLFGPRSPRDSLYRQ
ncbi:hypothetical protein HWV62_44744 [Athelia sp. TMB]|nr:hypothetical protein HWV62_44744 [Athelia sp. TMB]